jgi:hypothetical protein
MIAVNPKDKGDITGTNILWEKRDDQTLSLKLIYKGNHLEQAVDPHSPRER